MKPRAPVPAPVRWLLRLVAPAQCRDAMLADLEEEAEALARNAGVAAARRWSRRQALGSSFPLLVERSRLSWAALRSTRMYSWRGLRQDFSVAARRLADARGFTLVCVATLAIGIGANTAIFTLIDRVILKPLPVPRPAELYRVGDTDACCVNSGLMGSFSLFSYDLYRHLRDAAPEFVHLAAFQANTRAITVGHPSGATPPETLTGAFVSGNYFQMFEVTPSAGRLVQPSDDQPGAPPSAVISFQAWMDRFQGRADAIGRIVTLNGVAATIVGVAPRGFYGDMLRPDPPQIWVPLALEPQLQPPARLLEAKRSHWLYAIGRLKPDADVGALQPRLTAVLQNWLSANVDLSAEDRAQLPRQHITIISAAGGVNNMRDRAAPALRLLQALAAAVLLIACANLANLLLARSFARRTEVAVRVALGAPRFRLVQQFFAESVLLACLGGAAGLAVAYGAARGIVGLAFRYATHVPIDPTPSLLVLGFAFALSLVTAAIFGAAPAILGSRSDPIDALRGAVRTTADRSTRLRQALIALQIAVSVVLVTCAGLLAQSLRNLERQNFGFAVENRYVVGLAPSFGTVPAEQLEAVYARLLDRLRQIPGVVNASYSLYAPMSGDNWAGLITVEGHAPTERLAASWNRIGPGYFDTIGTPLLRGRAFDDRDRPDAPPVAIATQAFAKKFFGDADPIGRRIGFTDTRGTGTRDFEIVGLVGDAKYQDGRGAPYPTFFLPFLQQTDADRRAAAGGAVRIGRSHYAQALELHTAGALQGIEGEVRRALADVDPRLTTQSLRPMHEQIAGAFNLQRLIARLTEAFGGVALLLACLGLYGVTAYSVTQRTREIGIRMAVGASKGQVMQRILRAAALQLGVGIGLGLPAAYAAGRFLQAQLFGVRGHDAGIIASGLALLTLAALVAAWIPARRAATMDPVTALRID